ncbi:hypothetical protein [Kitasatospora sp. NPDC057015]
MQERTAADEELPGHDRARPEAVRRPTRPAARAERVDTGGGR